MCDRKVFNSYLMAFSLSVFFAFLMGAMVSENDTKDTKKLSAAFFSPSKILSDLVNVRDDVLGDKAGKLTPEMEKGIMDFSENWLEKNLKKQCPVPCLLITDRTVAMGNLPDLNKEIAADFRKSLLKISNLKVKQ